MRWILVCALALAAVDAQAQVGPRGGLLVRQSSAHRAPPPSPDQRTESTTPHPAVCRIVVTESDGVAFGSGTLVDVRGDYGLVLTNWHVVADADGPITVMFPDGFHSAAKVVRTDRVWDLAALAVWKPTADPAAISTTAPRPGDRLWIAGYGHGDYRIVSGPCTQYVAPGMRHPYEMVELAAAARQGDSGGPIFNEQGELAGVLFGESDGATAGSYCGRVAAFLRPIVPRDNAPADAIASAPTTPDEPLDHAGDLAADSAWQAAADVAASPTVAVPVESGEVFAGQAVAPYHREEQPTGDVSTASHATEAMPLGASLFEQLRSLLALIGGGFLLVQFLKLLTPAPPKPSDEEAEDDD